MFRNILALLILSPLFSLAQFKSDFKDGVYYSIEDLNNNNPRYDTLMEISTYLKKDTIDALGSRYKIKIGGEEYRTSSVFCIVHDGYIYIHNRHFDKRVPGFKKVVTKSKKFYRFIFSSYNGQVMAPYYMHIGLLGSVIISMYTGELDGNFYREPALIDIKTGKFMTLSEKEMVFLLFNDYHDLYTKYRDMKDKHDVQKLYELIDEYEQRLN